MSKMDNEEQGGLPGGLYVEGLSKNIGSFALQASFTLGRTERMVVQAASGAGKTSLLRVIAGLEQAEQGHLLLDGRDITRVAAPKREIGVVFQDAALFGSMSVWENAAFGLRMRGAGKLDRREQALRWLERVGLAKQADASVQNLSGGERQRVSFVRALIWKPKLLLLDEPFSALDSDLRAGLRNMLLELLREWPVPMILVSHDREDAEALATCSWSIAETSAGVRQLQKKVD